MGEWSSRRSKCEGARATRAVGAKPKPYPRERESTRAHGVLPSKNERPFHKIKPKEWRASARTRTRGREAARVPATLAAESAAVPNTSVAARTNPARRQHTSTAAATAATAVAAAAAASSFCTAAHSDAWRNSGTRVRNMFARTCEGLCVRQRGSHVAGGARCARVSGPTQSWRRLRRRRVLRAVQRAPRLRAHAPRARRPRAPRAGRPRAVAPLRPRARPCGRRALLLQPRLRWRVAERRGSPSGSRRRSPCGLSRVR